LYVIWEFIQSREQDHLASYCAETEVAQIGKKHGKVYGLVVPEKFERQQRRDYVQSKYSTTALFTSISQNTSVSTEIFDFPQED